MGTRFSGQALDCALDLLTDVAREFSASVMYLWFQIDPIDC
jgi:hypothetical protein